MLFWITLIVTVVSFVIWWKCGLADDAIEFITSTLTLIGIIALIVLVIIMCVCHIGNDGYVAAMHERYESLTYQYENDIYENDNDVGKRELMVEIQEWNEDLAGRKENQDDFWIGIFIPDIYDQFEFIELEE